MPKKYARFTDKKIVKILQEKKDGATNRSLCKKYGMSIGALHLWQTKYSGMSLEEVTRLRSGTKKTRKVKKQSAALSSKKPAMKKSTGKSARYTDKKVFEILQEKEDGASLKDLCRKHGVSVAAIYDWKAKFGGMDLEKISSLRSGKKKARKMKMQGTAPSPKKPVMKENAGKPAPSFWSSVRAFFS